ncbi:hypothetical protein [Spirosoma sp. 48-14]|uniref:hypothetical protein n=1 Tax=Spirosoma sp. 48-14 TaxID=1895854 RepID=UPI000963F71A|nr:hypothetical protein [Spirosoma sp. 48-14]OJW75074.1 MAG: hypothetical protein BGO59_19065 [Spirosoma sp. 48-14]
MTNIIFICSSLEPGRDGVGDYTRYLSYELVNHGYKIAIIALHDRYVFEDNESSVQTENGKTLRLLRLSIDTPISEKLKKASQFINTHKPDLLSLQFVPFGFHPKGLPFWLNKFLKKLSSDIQWHFMFHELWVGMAEKSSVKLIFWGYIQRLLIINLVKSLRPFIINTQSHTYQQYLKKYNINSEILPLITNIPPTHYTTSLKENPVKKAFDTKTFNFVVFGSIHPYSLIEQLAIEVANKVKQEFWSVTLTILGRQSNESKNWIAVWKRNGLNVNYLGEQSAEEISKILSQSTIGLSSTAFAVIEKSGSVAAMLAHGLPVLCIASEWKPRGIIPLENHPGILAYKNSNLETVLQLAEKTSIPIITVSDIARQFIRYLE